MERCRNHHHHAWFLGPMTGNDNLLMSFLPIYNLDSSKLPQGPVEDKDEAAGDVICFDSKRGPSEVASYFGHSTSPVPFPV